MADGTLDVSEVGHAVRSARIAAGIDQRDLADELGVSPVTLRRLESGQGATLQVTLDALRLLGVRIDLFAPRAPRERVPSPTRHRVVLGRPEERVQLELHKAVARRLRTDPDLVLDKARANLATLRANVSGARAHGWVNDWATALNGPLPALIALCVRQDEYGIDMRQVSPFAGALTQDERLAAISKGRRR